MTQQPEPFTLHVPDDAIADLRERLVRTRYPTEEELARKQPATYPQREAVRWALRELGAAAGD